MQPNFSVRYESIQINLYILFVLGLAEKLV